jgi:hypothetical protein
MPEESGNVRIKVKLGESEAEVEASLASIREAIELIPAVLARLPKTSAEPAPASLGQTAEVAPARPGEPVSSAVPATSAPSSVPIVTVEKGDSLSDVITKFFSDPWGRSPRKLMEVREALQSYGLNYPKQSVAVALLRLAKGSRIRRFKGEGGEYVYTASTGVARIPGPVVPAVAHAAVEEEASPVQEIGEGVEEQLDLDAPAAN